MRHLFVNYDQVLNAANSLFTASYNFLWGTPTVAAESSPICWQSDESFVDNLLSSNVFKCNDYIQSGMSYCPELSLHNQHYLPNSIDFGNKKARDIEWYLNTPNSLSFYRDFYNYVDKNGFVRDAHCGNSLYSFSSSLFQLLTARTKEAFAQMADDAAPHAYKIAFGLLVALTFYNRQAIAKKFNISKESAYEMVTSSIGQFYGYLRRFAVQADEYLSTLEPKETSQKETDEQQEIPTTLLSDAIMEELNKAFESVTDGVNFPESYFNNLRKGRLTPAAQMKFDSKPESFLDEKDDAQSSIAVRVKRSKRGQSLSVSAAA